MGGFLLLLHDGPLPAAEVDRRLRDSVRIMEENGLRPGATVRRAAFTLLVFRRRLLDDEALLTLGDTDFVAVAGTLFHRRRTVIDALRTLFEDFDGTPPPHGDLRGHFCAIVHKAGALHLFTDLNGIQQVYASSDGKLLGSSFLAVAKGSENRAVRVPEMYEHIFCGPLQGTTTVLEGVDLVDSRRSYRLTTTRTSTPRSMPVAPDLAGDAFLQAWSERLDDYAAMLRDAFADRVALAMSGGFDSRLLQAAVRRAGVRPYTYVYGPDDAPDVVAARAMASAEAIPLEVINHLAHPVVPPEESAPVLRSLFLFFDGLATQGAIGSGQELSTRLQRSADVEIQPNGGGGESYRNFWRLPASATPVRALVAGAMLGHVDFRVATPLLRRQDLVDSMEARIGRALELDTGGTLPPRLATLYARLYQHHWVGRNMSNNATLTHALAPLAEAEFTALGDCIPHAGRLLGNFEAPSSAACRRASRPIAQRMGSPSTVRRQSRVASWSLRWWARPWRFAAPRWRCTPGWRG